MAKWDLSKLPEGRAPLPDEWFRERAQMQERIEELEERVMREEPFYIVMKHVEEHENGDATYTFDMSDKAAQSVIEEGLTLLLYCGINKVDLQDVYDWILSQGDNATS